jgi:Putative peptidoglycan binding domain
VAKLLQIGMSTAGELGSRYGHIACTLGGVNYESRGGRGCLKGSAARGATNPLFRHHFHLKLSDDQAAKAKAYADSCVGEPYVLGGVPTSTTGGDCSGFVSGIICKAKGKPLKRLFATATWLTRFDDADMGFSKGLGGLAAAALASSNPNAIGRPDRPYPGRTFSKDSPKSDHVKWIQARLNIVANNKHEVLGFKPLDVDGDFGDDTFKVVRVFQKHRGLQGLGQVGPKTWKLLNAVR